MSPASERIERAAGVATVHDDRTEAECAPPVFTHRQLFVLGVGFGAGFGFFCLVAAGVIAFAVLA